MLPAPITLCPLTQHPKGPLRYCLRSHRVPRFLVANHFGPNEPWFDVKEGHSGGLKTNACQQVGEVSFGGCIYCGVSSWVVGQCRGDIDEEGTGSQGV